MRHCYFSPYHAKNYKRIKFGISDIPYGDLKYIYFKGEEGIFARLGDF